MIKYDNLTTGLKIYIYMQIMIHIMVQMKYFSMFSRISETEDHEEGHTIYQIYTRMNIGWILI